MLLQHDSPLLGPVLGSMHAGGDSAQACLPVCLCLTEWLTQRGMNGSVRFKRKGGIKGEIKYSCCYWDMRKNADFRRGSRLLSNGFEAFLEISFFCFHTPRFQVWTNKCAPANFLHRFYVTESMLTVSEPIHTCTERCYFFMVEFFSISIVSLI